VNTPSHVCLVGEPLCLNWQLVQQLAPRHDLTLLVDNGTKSLEAFPPFDVVAIDCRHLGVDGSVRLVNRLKGIVSFPIVVLDGGLNKKEVAMLFDAGAADYFPEPFNVHLIAERLEHLADSNRSRREESAGAKP
jgi:DNA-binding response OmpR family regulator